MRKCIGLRNVTIFVVLVLKCISTCLLRHSGINAAKENQGCTQHATLISRNADLLVAEQHSARKSHIVLIGDPIRVQRKPIELGSTNREMLARVDV